jgi:hypothetical protein
MVRFILCCPRRIGFGVVSESQAGRTSQGYCTVTPRSDFSHLPRDTTYSDYCVRVTYPVIACQICLTYNKPLRDLRAPFFVVCGRVDTTVLGTWNCTAHGDSVLIMSSRTNGVYLALHPSADAVTAAFATHSLRSTRLIVLPPHHCLVPYRRRLDPVKNQLITKRRSLLWKIDSYDSGPVPAWENECRRKEATLLLLTLSLALSCL